MAHTLNEVKKRYFNLSENDNIEETHLWQVYLRIFSLLFTAFFPLVMMQFFLFITKNYNTDVKSISLESIGYTLNIVFIIIYYTICFIGLISSKLKKYLNNSSTWEEKNRVIKSGIYALFTIIGISLLVYIVVSIIYSRIRASSLTNVSRYIESYTIMMTPIIIFNMIANFYINLSFSTHGIKSSWLLISLYPLMLLEIILIYIFLNYIHDERIILLITAPSLCMSFLKMIIFTIIFYSRTTYFYTNQSWIKMKSKTKFFSCSKKTYVNIIKRCRFSIYFAIALMLTLVIQSLFIKFAYSIDNSLGYLYTEDNHNHQGDIHGKYYILLFVKIIVYNILYLVFLFSRSFNISMLEQENGSKKTFLFKLERRKFLRKINFLILSISTVLSFSLYFALEDITNNLFKNLSWYNDEVIKGTYFIGKTYKSIIPFLVKESFLYGIIAFYLVEQSINNRIIIFRTDQSNIKLFILIIFSYSISTSLFTYIFAFVLNHIFLGLSGFMISYALYGSLSLLFIWIFELIRSYNLYIQEEIIDTTWTKTEFMIKKYSIDNKFLKKTKQDFKFYLINFIIQISILIAVILLLCLITI